MQGRMWSDRDMEEQYIPDHLLKHHMSHENGVDLHRHGLHGSMDHMESNRLMSHGDPMLAHIGDQVDNS